MQNTLRLIIKGPTVDLLGSVFSDSGLVGIIPKLFADSLRPVSDHCPISLETGLRGLGSFAFSDGDDVVKGTFFYF